MWSIQHENEGGKSHQSILPGTCVIVLCVSEPVEGVCLYRQYVRLVRREVSNHHHFRASTRQTRLFVSVLCSDVTCTAAEFSVSRKKPRQSERRKGDLGENWKLYG